MLSKAEKAIALFNQLAQYKIEGGSKWAIGRKEFVDRVTRALVEQETETRSDFSGWVPAYRLGELLSRCSASLASEFKAFLRRIGKPRQ